MPKFWSYLLLFCFVVLSTPKTVFHAHEDHHSEEDAGACIEEDGCFVCDFDYTNLATPISVPVFRFDKRVLESFTFITTQVEGPLFAALPARAPPMYS